MSRPRGAMWLALALAAGCGAKGCRAESERSEPSSRAGSATGEAAGIPEGVRLFVVESADEHALRVEIHGPGEARLSGIATIERRGRDGRFAGIARYRLVAACDDAPTDCLALTAGAELRPPPWRDVAGDDVQCGCERCARAEPGTYRFVVEGCDGGRLESEPFELAP